MITILGLVFMRAGIRRLVSFISLFGVEEGTGAE
jgi:hypothetical protein